MTILKTHVSLNVTDIKKSVDFYQAMFGISPVKYKSDYAKFDVANPPLNLTLQLNPNLTTGGTLSHLGIQVETTDEVKAAIERFREAGLDVFEEVNTNCCYALQDKVWLKDPDNNSWEVFVVKVADTAPEEEMTNTIASKKVSPCCAK
jgi:catechol 2,3-dioxygenase-like lactoylglutathione lyase family enzyme